MSALLDSIARCAGTQPDALALSIPGDEDLSWAELEGRSNRLANALLARGCRPGDRIGFLAENSIAYAIAFIASLKAGSCAVPLPLLISAESLRLMVAEVEAAAMFVSSAQWATWEKVASALPRPLPMVISLGCEDTRSAPVTIGELLATGSPGQPWVEVTDEMLFNIIYSSGTTGMPKGIVHSHAFRCEQVRYVAALANLSSSSTLLIATPFYSNSTITPFNAALTLGAQCILMRGFDTEEFIAHCAERRPTHAAMVPVQLERVLDHPGFGRARLERPMTKISGAAKLTVARKREIVARWPGNLIECYGMSEGGPVTALDAERDDDHLDTVGRPLLDSDVRLINDEDQEVESGTTGEVVGRSKTMMSGYYRQPELTAQQQWHDSDGRTYLRTGDIGRFDAAGYLSILDRKKEVIISGGFNIYASDLEAVLREHVDVAEAAVVGVHSSDWGETPVAYVVMNEEGGSSAEDIRAWANDRLGKVQRLAAVMVRRELPRGGLGKVLKRQLRAEYEASQTSARP